MTDIFIERKSSCKFLPCPKIYNDFINVHIVPMSSLNPLWLQPFGELYNCTDINYDDENVNLLLDSVYRALISNSSRKFVLTQMDFFQQWWNDIDHLTKSRFRSLVENGQFQFVSGGYVINDEATTHYSSIINQISLGLNFIKMNFGNCARPSVAWQIDTYGHSREMADIMKNMDFKAIFISHIPSQLMKNFQMNHSLEFLWKTTENNSTTNEDLLFGSILPIGFIIPPISCLNSQCANRDHYLKTIADYLISYLNKKIVFHKSNHIFISLGCDLYFQQAVETFQNFERIMDYINLNQNVFRVFYSTPLCYIEALVESLQNFRIYTHDFFPYDELTERFWTGFYSSRTTLKFNIRFAESAIKTCKMITSLSDKIYNRMWKHLKNLLELSKLISIMQHHHIITGTSKSSVIKSKLKQLFEGLDVCLDLSISGIESIMKQKAYRKRQIKLFNCPYLNMSFCPLTDNIPLNRPVNLLIFNPLPYSHSAWISVPVSLNSRQTYEVTDVWNIIYKADLVPIDAMILNNKERPKRSKAKYNLLFKANLPETGYITFTIKRRFVHFYDLTKVIDVRSLPFYQNVEISNSKINLTLDLKTNKIILRKDKLKFELYLGLKCYCTNLDIFRSLSGIYISQLYEQPKKIKSKPQSYLLKGSVIQEIRRKYSKGIGLVIRLYEDEDNVEIEWIISGIVQSSNFNREYVLSVQSEFNNKNVFYTDSNGRQLIKRKVTNNIHIESNFYPATSHVLLGTSNNTGILIHTDRSLGVGGTNDNGVELMLNRIILSNDRIDPKENLKEIGLDQRILGVIGKNWIEFGTIEELKINRRIKSNEIYNKPIILIGGDLIKDIYLKVYNNINKQPRHLNILTLEPILEGNMIEEKHLLRLENLRDFSSNEKENILNTIEIELQDLFENYDVKEVTELNLSGDKELKFFNKISGYKVKLKPMEIKTFKMIFSEK